MRILFLAGLACGACAVNPGQPRQLDQSEVESSAEVVSKKIDASGTYTVTCQNGTVECKVTISQIQGNQLCKVTPARGATQVNPMAFNAFSMWRDGDCGEVRYYPQSYDFWLGQTLTPDGVFFVEKATFWHDEKKFIGVPTNGAKVVNGVLEYPVKNGRQLKLKFTDISLRMTHGDAVAYCRKQGMRLPTLRELFDYCAAGVSEPNYGLNFIRDMYPSTARCGSGGTWSASLLSSDPSLAWMFYGAYGFVDSDNQGNYSNVRCVGGQ